jgi:hypothetical protein
MNLKALWERCGVQRRAPTAAPTPPIKARTPKPFQPLTHGESIATLWDAIQWLIDETRTTYTLPNGPFKMRRYAELQARDKSLARDFARLVRKQEG